ncbi:hypothetical protein [Mycobacterium sp.]|uniref:hypothetical protein n=1 Tax=Mycobacterium sp. TaxID=1785 RepID=UPI002D89D196|nr:hypothetical protein [Mycobacterium sp.]
MSPTIPTFIALNAQLIKAHHRIRELEAREAELRAQIGSLRAVITERTRDGQQTIASRSTIWREDTGVREVS